MKKFDEYIIPINETAKDYDEMFVGIIRRQPVLIRCKDCKHQVKEWREDKRFKGNGYYACGCDIVGDACGYWALLGQDYDYCSRAERKNNG